MHPLPPSSICQEECAQVQSQCQETWQIAIVVLTPYSFISCDDTSQLLFPLPNCCTGAGIIKGTGNETSSSMVRDETSSSMVRDETRSSMVRDETSSSMVRDETRSSMVRDETRSSMVRDETRNSMVRGETRSSMVRDETSSSVVPTPTGRFKQAF